MLVDAVWFIGGLVLLLAGGESLVRGASGIARALGVPPIVIGLTVVAFGTSAPELVVAVISASTGTGGVAYGNVVGASIINIALILGVTALLWPLAVHPSIVTRELPMLLLATCAVLVLSSDRTLGGDATDRLQRGDGLILCLFFAVFVYYTVVSLLRAPRDPFVAEAVRVAGDPRWKSMASAAGLVLMGLTGLTIGGNLLVDAAVSIAGRLNMTPAAIGLTVVSIGTTFPELATSLLAARKGDTDLAVGNVVGSNIFNLLFVLGIASTVSPIDVPARGPVALVICVALTLVLLALSSGRSRKLSRGHGAVLLAIVVAYFTWVLFAPAH